MNNNVIDLKNEVQQADEAFALDWYKDNDKYTDIGAAVHSIKYEYIFKGRSIDEEMDKKLDFLVEKLLPFTNDIDLILPMPSFNPKHENNQEGDLKIMYILSDKLSSRGESG